MPFSSFRNWWVHILKKIKKWFEYCQKKNMSKQKKPTRIYYIREKKCKKKKKKNYFFCYEISCNRKWLTTETFLLLPNERPWTITMPLLNAVVNSPCCLLSGWEAVQQCFSKVICAVLFDYQKSTSLFGCCCRYMFLSSF